MGNLCFFFEHFDRTSSKAFETFDQGPGLGEDALAGVTALAPNKVRTVGFYAKDKYRPPDQDPHRALGRLQLEGCLQSQHRTSLRAPIQPPRGITTVSANDVWAFGDYYAADGSGQIFTLVLHWDGISWKIVPSPSPANSNTRVDILFGGTVIPQGNLWLVGNEFGRTLVLNATGQ
jgi:hypothetical protein